MYDVMEMRLRQMHEDGYVIITNTPHGARSCQLTVRGWNTLCAAAERPVKPRTPSRDQLRDELQLFNIHWISARSVNPS